MTAFLHPAPGSDRNFLATLNGNRLNAKPNAYQLLMNLGRV
jgi:hypothetical protein